MAVKGLYIWFDGLSHGPWLALLQVYYFTKGTLKIANKQFSAVKNDYEMTFNNETSVMPCEDGHNLPTVQFDFTKIDDLESKPKDSLIGKPVSEHRERGDYHIGEAEGLPACWSPLGPAVMGVLTVSS